MITSLATQSAANLKTILITGARGQLGQALSQRFCNLAQQPGSNLIVHCLDRSQLDLAQPETIREVVRRLKPNIIINAAAHTAVDQAELEPELAHAINAQGPGVLAEEAMNLDASLVHYSSDYVFNGEGKLPYLESDNCGPKSIYGASKLAGERAIISSGAKHLIFRTSWIYASHGANFLTTMLSLAKERETLSIIDDQWGAPTWVERIVVVTELAVKKICANPKLVTSNVYHLCPRGETTWYRYAAKVFELQADPLRKLKTLTPITSTQYEANLRASNPERIVANRPDNSRLNCEKLELDFGIRLPSWESDLKACLGQ
jgi:dTDP-4-dehydrorhamnose reductase